MLTEEQVQAVIEKARRYAQQITLDNEAQFTAAVQEQLNRITRGPHPKRHNTILALAESAIDPDINKEDVFARKDIVSKRIFYSKDKDWWYDPEYREVLEIVRELHVRWENEAALRRMLYRQTEWREKMYETADTMVERAQEMMNKFGLEEMEVAGEDGTIIIKPARWTWDTIPRLVQTADKTARLALGMNTEKVEQDITAEVTEVDPDEIRQSMRDKLAQMGVAVPVPASGDTAVDDGGVGDDSIPAEDTAVSDNEATDAD